MLVCQLLRKRLVYYSGSHSAYVTLTLGAVIPCVYPDDDFGGPVKTRFSVVWRVEVRVGMRALGRLHRSWRMFARRGSDKAAARLKKGQG